MSHFPTDETDAEFRARKFDALRRESIAAGNGYEETVVALNKLFSLRSEPEFSVTFDDVVAEIKSGE